MFFHHAKGGFLFRCWMGTIGQEQPFTQQLESEPTLLHERLSADVFVLALNAQVIDHATHPGGFRSFTSEHPGATLKAAIFDRSREDE